MFDKQYSSALLSIGSPQKDTGKTRMFNANGAQTNSIYSPHSTKSAMNSGSFKGIQILKSGGNLDQASIVSGREDGLRATDSETGLTSPKIANPGNTQSSPTSQRDVAQFNNSMFQHHHP